MKRIIPLFIFILLTTWVFAQDILEINPNPVIMHYDVDLTDNYIERIGHYDITNITNSGISLRWQRIISPDCPSTWDLLVCDNNQCYGAIVDSNISPELGLDEPAFLQPGITDTLFSLHVKPKGQAGCCAVQLEFYLTNDPNTVIETIDFDIKVNDPECLVSTSEEVLAALRVFPNPMTDYFQLEGNDANDVKNLVVYNLIGRQVRSFDATASNQFDMSGLPGGIYLLGMVGNEREILKTVRISRQVARP